VFTTSFGGATNRAPLRPCARDDNGQPAGTACARHDEANAHRWTRCKRSRPSASSLSRSHTRLTYDRPLRRDLSPEVSAAGIDMAGAMPGDGCVSPPRQLAQSVAGPLPTTRGRVITPRQKRLATPCQGILAFLLVKTVAKPHPGWTGRPTTWPLLPAVRVARSRRVGRPRPPKQCGRRAGSGVPRRGARRVSR
jgi:hypothetical protein